MARGDLIFVVGDADDGERADVALARRAGITRTRAQRALRTGEVTVDGEEVRPSHRLERGQAVAGTIPAPVAGVPVAQDIPIPVRYSDDRVLVVSKPAGVVTHPAAGHTEGTLVNALLGMGISLSGEGSTRPGIVHRLDKDTSGLLLVARDDDAWRSLVEALRRREVGRHYLALVRGAPGSATGTVDAPIGRHPVRRKLMAVAGDGRPAVTHFSVRAAFAGFTLLDVTLETGRTHQIRVHLAHIGHPVAGDRTYGGWSEATAALGLARPFLHAARLVFPHPGDGHEVTVTDELPGDLTAVLDALHRAAPG